MPIQYIGAKKVVTDVNINSMGISHSEREVNKEGFKRAGDGGNVTIAAGIRDGKGKKNGHVTVRQPGGRGVSINLYPLEMWAWRLTAFGTICYAAYSYFN